MTEWLTLFSLTIFNFKKRIKRQKQQKSFNGYDRGKT